MLFLNILIIIFFLPGIILWFCIALMLLFLLLGVVFLFLYLDTSRKAKIRDNFFYHAVHEMKTPLSTITLTSEMLHEMNSLGDDAQRLVKMIITENKRISQTVDLFLHFARIERDELLLHKETLDIHALLEDSLLIHEFFLEQQNGILNTNFGASKYIIEGDRAHLTNVFDNLLDNARKYSEAPAEISVFTRNAYQYLVVAVADKGIGIEPANHKYVFKQFYRASGTNDQKTKGFGLGLFYVKHIVEKHGGRVKLISQPGKGSCFEVYLSLRTKKN